MAKKPIRAEKPKPEVKTEALFVEIRRAIQEYRTAAHLVAIGTDRMCPVFYRDEVYHLSLPWADFDSTQQRI